MYYVTPQARSTSGIKPSLPSPSSSLPVNNDSSTNHLKARMSRRTQSSRKSYRWATWIGTKSLSSINDSPPWKWQSCGRESSSVRRRRRRRPFARLSFAHHSVNRLLDVRQTSHPTSSSFLPRLPPPRRSTEGPIEARTRPSRAVPQRHDLFEGVLGGYREGMEWVGSIEVGCGRRRSLCLSLVRDRN